MIYLSKTVQGTVKNWWVSLVVGVLLLMLGVIFIFHPPDALFSLTYLFTVCLVVVGIFEIVFSVNNKDFITGWGWGFAYGILDILIGIILIFIPVATPLTMVYFIGFWIMFQSIWGIGVSSDLQRILVEGWSRLFFLSVLCLLLSFLFIISFILMSEFTVLIAAFAFIIYGIFRIYLSIKFKSLQD